MIIVELSGGLGNQMFQYALYLKLKSLGKEVVIDASMLLSKGAMRHPELSGAFDIDLDTISISEMNRIRGYAIDGGKLTNAFLHFVRNRKYAIYRDGFTTFQDIVFNLDNVVLSGYWQSEKYFADISSVIRERFWFRDITEENLALAKRMKTEDSVSIHIRCTDYFEGRNGEIYGNICTQDYYQRAIQYIREKVQNPRFYIFTDDKEWVNEHFAIEDDMMIVANNGGKASYQDMYLISSCKNNIMANSSFSWWGVYLKAGKGIVVCPNKWLNHCDVMDNIVCENWIRM